MNNINFSFEDLEKCARRELAQRRRVYPRFVARKQISQKASDREIALMSAMAEYFEAKNQPKLL
jgi:hypothetical protein